MAAPNIVNVTSILGKKKYLKNNDKSQETVQHDKEKLDKVQS